MQKNNGIQEISWRQLKKLNLSDRAIFQLSLMDSASPLICQTILRVVPGKRMVIEATWEDKPVVAKLFYQSRKASHHLKEDVKGVESLVFSGVPTPKLLLHSVSKDKHIHVVIFEKIHHAKTLDVLWQEKKNQDEMTALLRHVMIELATQHVLGIVQTDLHLKNFLISNQAIYTLDGGSIEQVEGILSKEKSLDHLALFFAQLGVGQEHLQKDLFDTYTKARSWIVKEADRQLLEQSIVKHATIRWKHYQKKIFRPCSAFQKIKKISRVIMYDREYESPEFVTLLKNPEGLFSHPETKLIKSGRSSTVARVKINNREMIIKRYNLKNPVHWLRRCLRETRAATSWRMSHRLTLMGIATAKPIAFIENRFLGLRDKSYFIMDYVDGPHLGDYFTQYRTEEKSLNHMATQILHLLTNLLKIHLTHGDLKITNILIEKDRPVLLDLDGMKEHKTFYGLKRAWQREVNRFLKNWENFPSIQLLFERILL